MKNNLEKLTLKEALDGLKAKKFSCVELNQALLDKIETQNSFLNVYLTINKELIDQAKKIDHLIKNFSGIFVDKPLLGIPIAVKDNFLTEKMETTASSKVLSGFFSQYESTVTRRLKEAGAIIIGKTNMDAWAHGSSTETSDFGATRNPWDINRLPGGSSGGSAAAVIADLCIAAIGSETAGSIRQPAAWCGCTGLKPSYGRVSRYGVIAMASSTDSPGPLAKTVADSVEILNIIAGEDKNDATTISGKWFLNIKELEIKRSFRLGLVKDYFLKEAEEGVNETVFETVRMMEKSGINVREISLLDPKYSIADYTIIQRAEVSSNLARYDGTRYGNKRSFFASEAKRRIMLGTHVLSSGYHDQYYLKAQKVRTAIIQNLEEAFKKVDLLISPTSPSTALPLGSTKGQSMFGELQDVLVEASSMAGLPGISLPCGFVNGLPIGLQIIGRMGDEASVLKLAHRYQQLTDWHKRRPDLEKFKIGT